MKPKPPPLLPVFRSRLIGDLLALVLLAPERRWTAEELAERTGAAYPTVTRELRRLSDPEIVVSDEVGRSRLWRANDRNPYFSHLAQLVAASFGPPQVVAEEFQDVAGVEDLFIFGSWAARYLGESGPTPHDVDVLVLGQPSRTDVYEAARRAERRLGRDVNTTIRPTEEWRRAHDGFASQVKSSPIYPVIGPWSSDRRDA